MTRFSIRRSRRGSQPVSISTGGSARQRRAIQAANVTILDQPVAADVDNRRRLMPQAQAAEAVEVELGLGLVMRGGAVFLKQGGRVTKLSSPSTATTTDIATLLNQLITNLVRAQHLEA